MDLLNFFSKLIKNEKLKNVIIPTIILIYLFLTLILPLSNLFGGLLTFSENVADSEITINFLWTNVRRCLDDDCVSISYEIYVETENLSTYWLLISYWTFLWIFFCILGVSLVIIPSLVSNNIINNKKYTIRLFGIVMALISSFTEVFLFIIGWIFEKESLSNLRLNIPLLSGFILGWILLFSCLFLINRMDPKESK